MSDTTEKIHRKPPPMDEELRAAVVALIAPACRAAYPAGTLKLDEVPDADIVADAPAGEILDALHAAGLLVFDHSDDRAHLRASWAAMSGALVQLAARREVDVDVIQRVPVSHRGYLQGHAATYRQLAVLWGRIESASELVSTLVLRAGGNLHQEATVTVGELGAALDILRGREQTVDMHRIAADRAAKMAAPAPLVDLGEEVAARARLLDRMVEVRARLKPCDVWETPELAPGLPGQTVPKGARVYAATWPAGTRAFASGEQACPDGEGETVASRYLYVDLDGQVTPESVFVGRVRRLHPEEMTREKSRWWRCRYCRMGATGAVSVAAEQAECLGHEAICPDQDGTTR